MRVESRGSLPSLLLCLPHPFFLILSIFLSSRFSKDFPHFTRGRCGQLALTPGFAPEIYVRMERSRHPPPTSSPLFPLLSSPPPPPLLPHRFTTCPLTWTNFRMRISAPTFSATPSFVASCTIDAIGKIVGLALRAKMIYRRGSRARRKSSRRDADPTLIRDVRHSRN